MNFMKDILLITGSVLIFGYPITPLQVIGKHSIWPQYLAPDTLSSGYSVALAGLVLFKTSGSK